MIEFERPTPQQRIDELEEVARRMGNNQGESKPPASIIFHSDGSIRAIIGIPLPFPQGLEIPSSQSGVARSGQKGSGDETNKREAKTQPPMKDNQKRHTVNLSGYSGWRNGRYYRNGQPMERREGNTNRSKKNGNGRH